MKTATKKLNQMILPLKKIRKYRRYILILLILVFIAWYVSTFWYQFALLEGISMEPAYRSGQFVLLEKRCRTPVAGEVYAFYSENLDSILIKRVVAVPGDTVLIQNGILYVNGVPSFEGENQVYIDYGGIAEEAIELLEKEYFVLGDNYIYSKDSRYVEIGCISLEDFVGRVIPQK